MKWSIKKSEALKIKIARNEALMKNLGQRVSDVFRNHGIELKGMSYVFEPRVFTMSANEAPNLVTKARRGMVEVLLNDMYSRGEFLDKFEMDIPTHCLPQCGPLDRFSLDIIEKFRLKDSNPIPPDNRYDSGLLMKQIMSNKKLLRELSDIIFNTLEENGIVFSNTEGCVFTPFVFETPAFAQRVGQARSYTEIRGFGPQVFADPNPDPWTEIKFKPLPGIIAGPRIQTPGVIVHKWWWIGIPAPEILKALDIIRQNF